MYTDRNTNVDLNSNSMPSPKLDANLRIELMKAQFPIQVFVRTQEPINETQGTELGNFGLQTYARNQTVTVGTLTRGSDLNKIAALDYVLRLSASETLKPI